tara:strand:+ start:7234 stop:7566 length:333 start_codon:yes stop_codon:yes gene_type:complete
MIRFHNEKQKRKLISVTEMPLFDKSGTKLSMLEENLHLFHTLEMKTADSGRDEKDVYLFFLDEHDQTKIRVLAVEHNKGDTFISWLDDDFATHLVKQEIQNFKEEKDGTA